MKARINLTTKMVLFAMITLYLAVVSYGVENQIISIDPDSAYRGEMGLMVTFMLDTDVPPAPPVDVVPQSITIDSIAGTSVTHTSQYIITAVFDIPSDEPAGTKDISISFATPQGDTLIFSMAGGFTIIEAADTPPSVTQQPLSQSVVVGRSVTLTISVWGTEPLTYQWFKDDVNIPDANSASYTIESTTYTDAAEYSCAVTNAYGSVTSEVAILTIVDNTFFGTYPIVDTGQVECYDNSVVIAPPAPGDAFYGQDAQFNGNQPSYTLSDDGLTVYDNVTGLTWTQTANINNDGVIDVDDKLTYTEAIDYPDTLNAANYGGYNDWRLPTIKELYSLMDFRGTDPMVQGDDTSGLVPFIDTDYFAFGYGDTAAGERIIDAQWASSTLYVSTTMGGNETMFGLNLADGRIKGYPTSKLFYVYFVRGNTDYGINDFVDNGDGTISDKATNLMWAQDDSGVGLDWQEALAWIQAKNAENYLGYSDWRLPNAKELQSIVDYTRSPDTTDSAAIDPNFHVTGIINEAGQADYPFFWSSTTHIRQGGLVEDAVYVSFGRGLGSMDGTTVIDVHGAGCQRSDPKDGDPNDYPIWGHGPQGDVRRVFNYVRCVRDAASLQISYPLVDTGQSACYDGEGAEIACPEEGEAFAGQDAQYDGTPMSYTDNGDGTVTDNVTGLMWQQTPVDYGYSWQEAVNYCESLELAGYDDWRMPTTKELFSISDFSQGWPYLDTTYFDLAGTNVSKDEQYWCDNYYVGTTIEGGSNAAFGVNHGTGHIKAYPATVSGHFGNYVRAVRGNAYGVNDFVNNGNGTITDRATGLMWQQADSGVGMDWEDALAYAQSLQLAGHDDWRLPNIKELQSIVDYTKSPSASDPNNLGPAIDTNYFDITELEDGTTAYSPDYGYFWSSTSAYFGPPSPEYYYAWYVGFGTTSGGDGADLHGAGAVRFDTKYEGGALGEGGERYYNYVRLVRNVNYIE